MSTGSWKTSANEVAQSMVKRLLESPDTTLSQSDATKRIAEQYGSDFTYINENGNTAIRKEVLDAFMSLTRRAYVYEAGRRLWRLRTSTDTKGRQQ